MFICEDCCKARAKGFEWLFELVMGISCGACELCNKVERCINISASDISNKEK